jgi:hypothetical protein
MAEFKLAVDSERAQVHGRRVSVKASMGFVPGMNTQETATAIRDSAITLKTPAVRPNLSIKAGSGAKRSQVGVAGGNRSISIFRFIEEC